MLCACSGEGSIADSSNKADKLITITIPESYFNYSGSEPAETVETCKELGEEYCTDAKVSGNDMIIQVTEAQRDNLIKRNNDYSNELVSSLLNADSKYSYKGSDEYTELSFYFDENLSTIKQIESVFGVAIGYGLNYILKNNTTDWSVHITIYNCHTNKIVIEANIPQDTFSYGAEEWKESYKE